MTALLSIIKYRQKVIVRKEPGVYIFNNSSGTGKTALSTWLDKFSDYGERTCSYTYRDYTRGRPIQEALDPSKYDLIVLDRYDLYYGVGKDLIFACAEKCVVLIDCKKQFTLCPYKRANVILKSDCIEVI